MWHTYLFEAKSIQSYILSTNKLKEIIGGSELIEQLTSEDGLVDKTIAALGIKGDIKFSRKGGAAFYAFSQNEASIEKLSTLWPLVFRQYAPDLEFIHAKHYGESEKDAFEAAHKLLLINRNEQTPSFPQASMYATRFPRTGRPATEFLHKEPVDEVTFRKNHIAQQLKKNNIPQGLIQRFNKQSVQDEWPVNLTSKKNDEDKKFPFNEGSQLIALIHADGNGLGQLLMNLKEIAKRNDLKASYVSLFREFSESIQSATEQSAKEATDNILESHKKEGLYPARPIVLGGDDLTMIVRADLALPFVNAFIKAFEINSEAELEKLKKTYPLLKAELNLDMLTACAGIVYAKSSHPFSLLHDLAEGLCKHAKKTVKKEENKIDKKTCSSISFYRVTTSLTRDYKDIRDTELTFHNNQLGHDTYTVHPHDKLPSVDALLGLQKHLEQSDISMGALRQVVGLLQQSPEQAQRRYDRWREVMESHEPKNLVEFDRGMAELKSNAQTLNFIPTNTDNSAKDKAQTVLPFEDVLTLSAVNNTLMFASEGGNV